jgi:homoserine O-acetyltransferase
MFEEYGELDNDGSSFVAFDFILECGEVVPEVSVRYNSYGKLNSTKSNVIVVCHALTGNSRVDQWWPGLFGPDNALDTNKYFIVCANVLGSCYGSTGPRSINPLTGQYYGISFPLITIRDTVRLHIKLITEHLGIHELESVIGGSMGGMQVLEWLLLSKEGEKVPSLHIKSGVVIGCGARHTAWQIGMSELQRQAIYGDPHWNNGNIYPRVKAKKDVDDRIDTENNLPTKGLSLARQIAMMSYRSQVSFHQKFGRNKEELTGRYQVQNYLEYQVLHCFLFLLFLTFSFTGK